MTVKSLHIPKIIFSSDFLIQWSVYDPDIRTLKMSSCLLTDVGWWWVDPFYIDGDMFRRESRDVNIAGILLTNENHERDSFEVARFFHCPVGIHEKGKEELRQPVQFAFRDQELLPGDLEVIYLPGSSRAECCFYDQRHQIAVMGDALIHLPETGFQFLPDKYCQDPVLARKSLQRLLGKEIKIMTFAHGEALCEDPSGKLNQLLKGAGVV